MAFFNVIIPNDVVDEFNSMKLRHTYQFILMKLTDDLKQVVIDKKVDKRHTNDEVSSRAAYEEFTQELKADECRFAIFDFHYTEGESGVRDKLIFLSWCPDSAPTKKKMTYTSCKEDIKKKLVGISHEIQATDEDELSYATIKDKVQKNK